MRSWNLSEIEAPDGARDPVVLHSDDEGRAVMIRLDPGNDAVEAGPGTLAFFEPDERRAISSPDGARLLMLLSPWPGEGHYRGGDQPG